MHKATLIIAAILCGCGTDAPEVAQDSLDGVINADHLSNTDVNALCQLARDTLRQRLPSTAMIDVRQAAVTESESGWAIVLTYDVENDRRTCCVLAEPLSDENRSPQFSRATTLYHEPPQPLIDFHASH